MRCYWHSGHINELELFKMNSDGVPEIFLAAAANHYGSSDIGWRACCCLAPK